MLKMLIAAGAAAVSIATAASATTLTYQGSSTGSSGVTARINEAPVSIAGNSAPRNLAAYGFRMTDSGGSLGSFVAWCLDLTNSLQTTSTYQVTSTPFSQYPVPTNRVQAVFDANFGGVDVTNRVQAAAFQLALWEATYDDDWSLTADTAALDDFRAQGNIGGLNSALSTSINQTAATYLTNASAYGGAKTWNLTYLQATGSPQSQSLITAAPVPVPAAGLLLLGALGAIVAVRRRTA